MGEVEVVLDLYHRLPGGRHPVELQSGHGVDCGGTHVWVLMMNVG